MTLVSVKTKSLDNPDTTNGDQMLQVLISSLGGAIAAMLVVLCLVNI